MLTKLHIKNFTLFKHCNLHFSDNLNIFIGENGTGKTHLLKLPHAIISNSAEEATRNANAQDSQPTKGALQSGIASKLVNVFRPDALGRLVKRRQGREKCEVKLSFRQSDLNVKIAFATNSKTEVEVLEMPSAIIDKAPVFFPTHELLTVFPGFVSLYKNYHTGFDETWWEMCLLLGAPAVKGPREAKVKKALQPLETAMGGSVVLDANGRFYLNIPGSGKMEMPLVAEGLRKLAMISRLIATGSLLDKGYLFWDEPETNLNPGLIKLIARVIIDLSKSGIQSFVSTHSLFLMREMEILLQSKEYKKIKPKIFAMVKDGDDIDIEQADNFDDIKNIASLDEELMQSDRFMEVE
ncbi:MAG: AAA family ATPase [Desulfotignum sp.]|jgi:predicted ATPase|nr:AAA family ATPase [Desulfotignum sp.]